MYIRVVYRGVYMYTGVVYRGGIQGCIQGWYTAVYIGVVNRGGI